MVHWIRFFFSFININHNKETGKKIIQINKIKLRAKSINNNKIMSMILLLFVGFYVPNSLSLLSTSHSFHNNTITFNNTTSTSSSTTDNTNMINTTLSVSHNKNILFLAHSDNAKLTTDTVLYSSGIYYESYT